MSQQPTPTASSSSPDWVGGALLAGLGLALAVAGLPILLVAGITFLVARRVEKRTRWIIAGIAGAAAGIVAIVPGWKMAGQDYAGAVRSVAGLVHDTHPAIAGTVASALAHSLPVAIPLGLAAGLGWDLRRRVVAAKKIGPGTEAAAAPTADRRQLAPLAVRARDAEQRVVLGSLDGQLLATEVERHTAIVAPTRSGKTRGLILPALLNWQGPVVATSSKADLLRDQQYGAGAYAYRASIGPVWVFDPSESSGWPCVSWSPLGRSLTWQGALRAARIMVDAYNAGSGSDLQSGTTAFFSARAAGVLAPALHAVALRDDDVPGRIDPDARDHPVADEVELDDTDDRPSGMASVGRLIRGAKSLTELADTLEEMLAHAGAEPGALDAVDALRSGSETSSGDVLATLANILAPFVDEPTVAANSEECDFSAAELIERNGTLFIVSGSDSKALAPLYACLLDEILVQVQQQAMQHGPLSPRILFALDEVANIAPIRNLGSLLSTLGGMGATIVTAWQSLSQMSRFPGGAGEILANSASQLWCASDDTETAEHLRRILGSQSVQQQSLSANIEQGIFGARTSDPHQASISVTEKAVLDPSVLRQLSGGPLLVHAGLPPTSLAWHYYDGDRVLSRRAALPLPAPEPDDDEPLIVPPPSPPAPEPSPDDPYASSGPAAPSRASVPPRPRDDSILSADPWEGMEL